MVEKRRRSLFPLGLAWLCALGAPAASAQATPDKPAAPTPAPSAKQPKAAPSRGPKPAARVSAAASAGDPGQAADLVRKGKSLIRAEHLKEAEGVMRQAAQARGQSIEALYDVARVTFASGDYRRSRAACRPLLQAEPNAAFSNLCMARAFLVWRRAARAEEYVEKARQADPSNPELYQVLGDMKRVQGDVAASKAAYVQVLQRDPNDPDAHFGLGQLYLIAPDPEAAEQQFRAALAHETDWPEALYELGRLASGGEAVELLKRAVAAKPKWTEARLALGAAQLAEGDIATAETLFREVLKANPNLPMAHSRLGMALGAKQDYAHAEAELKRGLSGLPNDPDAALALARVYSRTDRPEDAFDAYRQAAGLEPTGSRALVEAGTYALGLGRSALAQAFLEKALEHTPNSAIAHARYADALLARGEKDKAKEHYKLSLSSPGTIDRSAVQRRVDSLK